MVVAFEDWDEKKVHLVYGAMKQLKTQGQRDEFYPIGLGCAVGGIGSL